MWLLDAQRAAFGPLTPTASLGSSYGTWTSDGQRVLFRTATGLFVAHANGSASPEAIADTSAADFPNSVSPDGNTLVLSRQTREMSGDVYALSLRGPSSPHALVSTPAYEGGGQLSYDGKWLLYTSDESGKFRMWTRGPTLASSGVGRYRHKAARMRDGALTAGRSSIGRTVACSRFR